MEPGNASALTPSFYRQSTTSAARTTLRTHALPLHLTADRFPFWAHCDSCPSLPGRSSWNHWQTGPT
eukprot:3733048-Rhodomonas_salina.1